MPHPLSSLERPPACVDELLARAAARTPRRIALVGSSVVPQAGGRDTQQPERISWATLHERVELLAHGLAQLGAGPGVRVCIGLDNCVEHVVTLLAVWRCSAAAVLVHAATPPEKMARILQDAQAGYAVLHGRQLSVSSRITKTRCTFIAVGTDHPAPGNAPASVVPFATVADGRGADAALPTVEARNGLALLLYTSGSTGEPKGVMHGHTGLLHAARMITASIDARGDDVIFQVLPMSFGYGLTQLLVALHTGCTLVLERSFAFPVVTVEQLARERATLFAVVPTMAALLAQTDLTRHDLSALRTLTNAGAALPPTLARALQDKLPHVQLLPMYGQTECIRASCLAPGDVTERPSSVGRGMPGQEHWLVDTEGVRLPRGSTGELVVAGPHVMLGYWNRPEETARKITDGPRAGERTLRTGDLFTEDPDGWLSFVARTDDIIKTRGEKVSPREVEDALYACDGVVAAAVVGVPHPLLGEEVQAWVVPREGVVIDPRAITRHCATILEDFAVPRTVVVTDALPKTPNGKIDKQALRAGAAARGGHP